MPHTQTLTNRFPGFDGLRLLAAVLVIFSHAFVIATGNEATEPLTRLLGPGHVLGHYSVFTFFIISGFLLSRSLGTSPSPLAFAVNRTLRILPAFVACTLVTAFVIGPVCSAGSWQRYFSSQEAYDFVWTSLATFDGAPLPGLFAYPDQTGLATVINGSLWSLRYEALSYLFLLLVWSMAPSTCVRAGITAITALVVRLFPGQYALTGIAFTLPYFAGGVVMHWVYNRYGVRPIGAAAAVVLLLAGAVAGVTHDAFVVAGPYLLVFFAERTNSGSRLAGLMGDCSYGLYLYGWPAEQVVKQFTGTTGPLSLFGAALPLTLALALLSYHCIEAPAMGLRIKVTSALRAAFGQWVEWTGGNRRAAVAGARVAFVATTLFILSVGRWWQFATSMVEILLGTLAGAALAGVAHRLATSRRERRQAAHS